MKTAVCPGSFDPITYGHMDILGRASLLFDKVVVAVMVNPDKKPVFTVDERLEMIKKATCELDNIEVKSFDGLLADFAKINNAQAIIKGLRAVTDFEYEFQMSLVNRKLNPDVDTIFINSSAEYMYLSSSAVKTIARFGGDISDFVPECIRDQIRERLTATNLASEFCRAELEQRGVDG